MEDSVWPVPKFRFEVDLDDNLKNVAFQEVSGLDVEHHIIEYRKGNSTQFSTEKMPGQVKYGNITLRRGVFVNDNTFWNWHAEIAMNTIKRLRVSVKLLDETGQVMMQWVLHDAFPTKITSTDLKLDGNEIVVDMIELAYEQLEMSNGNSEI